MRLSEIDPRELAAGVRVVPGSRLFHATTLLLGPDDAGREVIDALYDLVEQRPALLRVLGCAEPAAVVPRLREFLADLDEAIVAAAAEALLFHGEPLGDAIPVLWASDDPDLRALGLKALPDEPAASKYARTVQAAPSDDDPVLVDTDPPRSSPWATLEPPSSPTPASSRSTIPSQGRSSAKCWRLWPASISTTPRVAVRERGNGSRPGHPSGSLMGTAKRIAVGTAKRIGGEAAGSETFGPG